MQNMQLALCSTPPPLLLFCCIPSEFLLGVATWCGPICAVSVVIYHKFVDDARVGLQQSPGATHHYEGLLAVILVGVSVGSSEALQQCCSCARRLALNSSKYLAHALQALCFASVPMMALEQAARDHAKCDVCILVNCGGWGDPIFPPQY